MLPGVVVALALAVHPPPPVHLRAIGWTLVVTSIVATVVLIAGLR